LREIYTLSTELYFGITREIAVLDFPPFFFLVEKETKNKACALLRKFILIKIII